MPQLPLIQLVVDEVHYISTWGHDFRPDFVDPHTLKALRGGLGESYRQSLQAILSEQAEGLTFAQVVKALCERQEHEVHHGTVRTLLYAGGFVQRNGRWFPAPQSVVAARKLRAALAETLIPEEQLEQGAEPAFEPEQLRKKTRAIRERLAEVIRLLRDTLS